MANRRIFMHEYQHVVYLLRQGLSVRTIAKGQSIGRIKIKRIQQVATEMGWLNAEKPMPDNKTIQTVFEQSRSQQQSSKVEPYAEFIKKSVEQGIQASVIHQYLVNSYGFTGAYNCVQRHVKKLKDHLPVKMTVPLNFKPGEAAQVDFGKGPPLIDERTGKEVQTWFFVMTLCFSRHQYAELVTHQDIETWLTCHQHAFVWFGGVVKKMIIDNPKCAITKACYYDPEVQRSYQEFAQGYGFIISACPPRDPQKKGRVESGIKYVKRNFQPFKTFMSLQDANRQLKNWTLSTAGNRIHGSTFERPLTIFTEIEQPKLKVLPATLPEVAVWQSVSLYKDCHVRYLKCLYSAPHELYQQVLWLKSTAKTITIYHEHQWVATHPRLFKAGERSTKTEHLPINARAYLERDADWCLKKSKEIGAYCNQVVSRLLNDQVRDLLRQAQGIIRLSSKYGKKRLELACERAITFNSINLSTISNILKEGLDYEKQAIIAAFDQLSHVYRGGGVYQRTLNELTH